MITASHVFDHVQCPHRPVMDATTPECERDETSAFTEMLWEQGVEHEASVLAGLGITADMSQVTLDLRESATLDAMLRKEPLIYRGRISDDDLLGVPDLLELQPNGGYIPGDIKSGSGLEGGDEETEGRLKRHYAVRLGHYSNILERLRLGDGTHMAFVVDNEATRVPYDLDQPQGVRNLQTWFDFYQDTVIAVRNNLCGATKTLPALGATCKLCHWQSACKAAVISANDLSLIAELGRSKRDVLIRLIPSVKALAAANIDNFISGKKTVFPGIGPGTLQKYQERAKLLSNPNAAPYLKSPVELPIRSREIYFDIEADPFKGNFVYLHGMVEREHAKPATAQFHPFFADGATPQDEEAVFAAAWQYLTSRISDSVIYYYSQYENTSYRRLAKKYPSVCSVEEVEALFASPEMIDLYAIVKRHTEWPCNNFSIKTLAVYCGFQWRDESPSGAASIEWYRRWIETGDPAIKSRLLEYNEDDNLATGYVVDAIRRMECITALAA
jgi:predicted RecB family nuclease